MHLQEFVSQMTLAFLRFMRSLVTQLFRDTAVGDIAATGRMLVRLSIFQAVFVLTVQKTVEQLLAQPEASEHDNDNAALDLLVSLSGRWRALLFLPWGLKAGAFYAPEKRRRVVAAVM